MSFPSPSTILLFITTAGLVVAEAQTNVTTNVPGCNTGPNALTAIIQEFLFPGSNVEVPQTCVEFGGHERCYYTYVPNHCGSSDDGSTGPTDVPLIVSSHGMGICPHLMALFDGWLPKAAQECMIVVYPMGIIDPTIADASCFNIPGGIEYDGDDSTPYSTRDCCCESDGVQVVPEPADLDPEFLQLVIRETVTGLKETNAPLQVDTKRIYLSGLSNGCITSLSTAALHSDLIAAVACHAGAVVTPVPDDYSPVPTWLVHGTKDGSILYNGTFYGPGLGFMSVPSGFEYLASKNGCQSPSTTEDFGDGNGTIKSGTGGCTAPVELLTLNNVGHLPYQGLDPLDSDPADAIVTRVDTSTLAWEFLKSHRKDEVPLVFAEVESFSPTSAPTDDTSSGPSKVVGSIVAVAMGMVLALVVA